MFKKCAEEGCSKIPSYNIVGRKPLYCFNHKKDGMLNVKTKRCAEKGRRW